MPRHIYVEAPSKTDITTVLHKTPCSYIRPRSVSINDIYPLVRYLRVPSNLPPFQWVRLTCGGRYNGRLGVVSRDGTVLVHPKYNISPTGPPTIVPLRLRQATVSTKLQLLELTFQSTLGAIEFLDPSRVAAFLKRCQSLIDAGHRDIFRAWYLVWQTSWPDGCAV